MLKLSFSARQNGLVSCCVPLLLVAILTMAAPNSVSAAGGSCGGSGGFGLGASRRSWGGAGGGLFGGRQPIRNLLGRVASRLGEIGSGSMGSRGGSFGGSGGGSFGGRSFAGSFGSRTGGWSGGSAGGWSGRGLGSAGSFASTPTASTYGSWGSSSSSFLSDSYSHVSTQLTAPVVSAPLAFQPSVDTSAFLTTGIADCLSCGTTGSAGFPIDQGYVETGYSDLGYSSDIGYSSDTGFYDGSLPNYDGVPVDDGQIIDDDSLYDPGILGPNDYYDGGGSLLDDGSLPPPPGPAGDDTTRRSLKRKSFVKPAVLSVALPSDAQVYINGRLTKTEGSVRNYVAHKLKNGKGQGYQVKAVVNRDGKRLVRTQTVRMKPGITRTVEFDFNKPVTTVLALKVPTDAKVRLCGAETSATGERRFFETSKLKDGESWENYEIEVVVNRDGKELVARKSLKLHAGDSQSMVFDFHDQTGKLVAVK